MRIKIGDRVIDPTNIDRLTLRHWIRIEQETAALGRPMKWGDIRRMVARLSALEPDAAESDDDWPWFLGILIWAGRYDAGESDITLEQAVDFSLADLEFLPDPDDLVTPGGGVGGPRRARPASGRAGKQAGSSKGKKKARSATPSSDA